MYLRSRLFFIFVSRALFLSHHLEDSLLTISAVSVSFPISFEFLFVYYKRNEIPWVTDGRI